MAIVINGSGTITGVSVGGLPDGSVDSDTLATGIDATKLADGTVTSTELQYINTLASNAQTQISGAGVTDSKFYAYITSQFNNVTGDDTSVDILGASKWTLKYNIGSDFDDGGGATEGTYTAPETGKYLFTWSINLSGVTTSYTSINLWMVTSNGNSRVSATHGNAAQSNTELKLQGAIITDLDASDTAYLRIIVGGSTKVINIDYSGTTHSHWQGALLA